MHLGEVSPAGSCEDGCECAPGYVEDEQGACVPATACPCHHGGRSYSQGDVIQKDCNTW